MTDTISLKPKGLVRRRPFAKGPSNRPPGRRAGSRNKKRLAAVFLKGEAEALTGGPPSSRPPGYSTYAREFAADSR